MAKHTAARIGLLALLVLAAAAQPPADINAVAARVQAALKRGSRSDATSCWAGNTRTCAFTASCTKSQCQCCGCPCASITCLFNTIKSSYLEIQKRVNALKTPADRKAIAPAVCSLAKASAKLNKTVINLYTTAKCPNYAGHIRIIKSYQANYNKWCKGFSG